MTNRKRALRTASLALAAITMSAVGTGALAADKIEAVELSADGSSYSRTLKDLFGPTELVPMDQATDTFWVRNGGKEPAYLGIAVIDVDIADPVVAGALTLAAGPAAIPGPSFPLDTGNVCLTLSSGQVLGPGEAVEIAAQLSLTDLQETQGQHAHIDFAVQVTLSDQLLSNPGEPCGVEPAPTLPPSPTPTPTPTPSTTPTSTVTSPSPGVAPATGVEESTNSLARTGATILVIMVVTALLLGAGLMIRVLIGRRREDDDSSTEGKVLP